jgi:colanic acid biosynthesis glycosyl transferase WcaI
MLSRRWRIPYVFHVADLQPDAALDLGMLPAGLLANLLYRIERLAYDRASVVSTLTEGMRTKILAKGITANKVCLFSDWADPRLFDIPIGGDDSDVRRRFGFEGQFLIVHAGNMGVKQGLDVVLGAAERLRAVSDMTFLLIGDGAVRAELQASAEARGLSNVKFLPLQQRPVFHDLLGAADICLVTQQRVVAEVVFPSKVVTLMAAGRPIVASVNPSSEVARVLIEAGGGVVVEAEEPSALADAVLSLRLEGDRRREMSARGRAYARRRWDKAAIVDDAERWLSDLVGPSPALRAAASR